MNKFGIFFTYWTGEWTADVTYYIKKTARLGFDVLEMSTDNLLKAPKSKQDEVKAAAKEHGIELTYALGFPKDKDITSESATIRKGGIEFAKKTMDTVHYMGSKILSGITYAVWQKFPQEVIYDKRPYWERSVQSMKEIIKTAEDYDITYCVEVVNRYESMLLNTAAEAVEFVKEIGSPNVKINLDTFHMNIEEDDFAAAILTTSDKLGHFHIGECNRKVPGKGHIPWDNVMGSLKKIGYEGRIIMEPFVKMGGVVGKDIKVWRDLSNGADEAQLDVEARNAMEYIKKLLL